MIAQLETERLILRPLTTEDADALVALDADPEVMRYLTNGRPTPAEEIAETVRATKSHRWVVLDRTSTEFLGWVSLRPTADDSDDGNPADRALGYRLRRQAWGRGIATEAARTVIADGFSYRGMQRVWAQTMAVNVASRRVMERCDLRFVRVFHLDWADPIPGTELGEVEYELRKAEWERTSRDPFVTQR
jgi:RimJ/RimL family protein N-acetyltransferase